MVDAVLRITQIGMPQYFESFLTIRHIKMLTVLTCVGLKMNWCGIW